MIDTIIFIIGISLLIYGSYKDIKIREVPDYANYFSIIVIIGLRLIDTIYTSEWTIFIHSILWFIGFVIIGLFMFYAGQWGGGDSKLLMVLGLVFFTYPQILLDLGFKPLINFPLPLIFLINILIFGALYGLICSFFLCLRNLNKFKIEWKNVIKPFSKTKIIVNIFVVLLLISNFAFRDFYTKVLLVSLALIFFLTFYLLMFAKAVEKACMFVYMNVKDLTEGEWVANNIIVKGKKICGPDDLGISLKQIEQLKKLKINKILIKKGIPFVPAFLIAGVVTWIFGNVMFMLL